MTGDPDYRPNRADTTDSGTNPPQVEGKVEPKSVTERVTIKEVFPVKEGGKVGFLTIQEHAKWGRVKYWVSSTFTSDLVAGAVAEAEIERVPSTNPNYPNPEIWLRKWDGKGEKGSKGKGGVGFRPSESETRTLALMATSAMEAASRIHGGFESVPDAKEIADYAAVLFKSMRQMVMGGKGIE